MRAASRIDPRHAASRNSLQQLRNRVPRRPQDLVGIVDGRLAQLLREIGRDGQDVQGLIGVGNQIDHGVDAIFEPVRVHFAGGQERKRIGLVAGIAEQELRWHVAAERRVERKDPEIGGGLGGRPPDQRLQLRGSEIGGLGCVRAAEGLIKSADPIETVRIS
jgi:hypothetical protein